MARVKRTQRLPRLRTPVVLLLTGLTILTTMAGPSLADDALPLTNDPEIDSFPSSSPDSTQIAVTRGDFQNYEIFFYPIDGNAPTPIIATTGSREPAWSSNAETLVWTRLGVIWRAALGGGGIDPIQLTSPTDGGTGDEAPSYSRSPDGPQIAFQSFRNDQFDIWIISQPPVPVQRKSWGAVKRVFAP